MSTAKKGAFDLHTFVTQSCLIDPQYDDRDYPSFLFPAVKPGQLMYDNTIAAFELATELCAEPFYTGIVMDLHRVLTKGIPWYENSGLSGRFRSDEVSVNNKECPGPLEIEYLIRERWFPKVRRELDAFDGTAEHALEIAWATHHSFEYIHPFADGNGRTGRLLLNHILMRLAQPPIVIWYRKRHEYYKSIQNFVDKNINDYLGLKQGFPI